MIPSQPPPVDVEALLAALPEPPSKPARTPAPPSPHKAGKGLNGAAGHAGTNGHAAADDSPGDDFNRRATWDDVLGPFGWRQAGPGADGEMRWTRPGKDEGCSATTGNPKHTGDKLHVFSDNAAPFSTDQTHDKFGAYALLNHGGDHAAAARELRKQGYGGLGRQGLVNGAVNGQHPPAAADDAPFVYPGTEDNPHRLANLFLWERHHHPDGITVRFWREEFHVWDGAAYRVIPKQEMRSRVTDFVACEFDRLYGLALMRRAMKKAAGNKDDDDEKPRLIPVTTRLITDVLQALTGIGLVSVSDIIDQPAWLGGDHPDWLPGEILPTRNALVHLPSFVDGLPCTIPPTPLFFVPYALRYPFVPDAPVPREWIGFLDSIWPDDAESIATLQEWMGYLLTIDTSQQKIMMVIGPPRSGKGTITRVCRGLIGHENVANPTLSALATDFGVAPLIGKPLAIINDARLSGRADAAVIVENLLSISGEDDQTINRKHRDAVTVHLPSRFIIVSNELPRLKDESGALADRMIILRLMRSFLGEEDTHLGRRLLAELPGILLWAIEGWKRLREHGEFVQPSAAASLVDTLRQLTSPIKTFVEECCVVGPEHSSAIPALYMAWRNWCRERGKESVGDEQSFGKGLHAVIPFLRITRPRSGSGRTRTYVGVALSPDFGGSVDGANYTEDAKDDNETPF